MERPDPIVARDLDELIVQLRLLKVWARGPSYEAIAKRINQSRQRDGCAERTSKSTVADCFSAGRARPDEDLFVAIVAALHPDASYLSQWRQAFRILRGEAVMASFVHALPRLPGPSPAFVGRDAELAHLKRLTASVVAGGRSPVVVIDGMAGVGKTQLAVEAGRRVMRRCDLSQVLFVDLHGFQPGPRRPPADPSAVLEAFLRRLGADSRDIPRGRSAVASRAALFRRQLSGRRVLVVLDNAMSAEQVRPLLPGKPGCVMLITSRNVLDDLKGAERLHLDVLSRSDAADLLRVAAGEERIAAEPETAAVIAEVLGRLPLALVRVAERIRADADWTLSDHLDRIADGLDETVRVALGASYEHLGPESQRVLRMLALHPSRSFDISAAAALAAVNEADAIRRVAELSASHLLRQTGPNRYEMHDLVRVYAAERTRDQDPAAVRRAAMARLVHLCTNSALQRPTATMRPGSSGIYQWASARADDQP